MAFHESRQPERYWFEVEGEALAAEHEALKREHGLIHTRPHDLEAHLNHRLKLAAHMDRLQSYMDRLLVRSRATI